MNQRLAVLPIQRPEDVFALRQSGRSATERLGCEEADQVRFATALSELGREALLHGPDAYVVFFLEDAGSLVVNFTDFPRAGLDTHRPFNGFAAARKLIEDLTVSDESGPTVTIVLRSAHVRRKGAVDIRAIKESVRITAAPQPLDRLRMENRDLITTLDELKTQQQQLVVLNEELEETNRGVMAMYAKLAEELEETNRGVVALYAELDDKSARLNEVSQAKSRFLANASHELRSPVNSVLGLVRLLLDPSGDAVSDEQRRELQLILASSNELLKLVNDLLDLAKAESGRLDTEMSTVDLMELFFELRGTLRPLSRPGVSLVFDEPVVAAFDTDRVLLTHILRNLISNALKFTAQGEVRVSTRLKNPLDLEIIVADTGIGIAPENVSKVFEEFFQVRGPMQIERRGTGLGLPYAQQVARTLGGDITLESEAGRGSTFTVRLPLRSEVSVTQLPAMPAAGAQVERALIIDDDEAFRMALRGMLQGVARHVLEASGGRRGLDIMRETSPEVAFIDLRMLDMDGVDIIAEMNSDPNLRSIPVVIVTSQRLNVPNPSRGPASSLLGKSELNHESVARVVAQAVTTAGVGI